MRILLISSKYCCETRYQKNLGNVPGYTSISLMLFVELLFFLSSESQTWLHIKITWGTFKTY